MGVGRGGAAGVPGPGTAASFPSRGGPTRREDSCCWLQIASSRSGTRAVPPRAWTSSATPRGSPRYVPVRTGGWRSPPSLDHTVRLWDLDDGNCLGILFDTDADAVHHCRPGGQCAARGRGHGRSSATVAPGRTALPLGVLESPAGEISHLAWSPSRGVLVGAGSKGALAIWDVRSEPGEQGGTGSHYVAGSPIARTVGGRVGPGSGSRASRAGRVGACAPPLRSISLAHV